MPTAITSQCIGCKQWRVIRACALCPATMCATCLRTHECP